VIETTDTSGFADFALPTLDSPTLPGVAPPAPPIPPAGVPLPGSAASVFSSLTPTLLGYPDDRLGDSNPITESGNGDLWLGTSPDDNH